MQYACAAAASSMYGVEFVREGKGWLLEGDDRWLGWDVLGEVRENMRIC